MTGWKINRKELPKGWSVKTVKKLTESIRTGGTPRKSIDEFWGGETPWRTSKHFPDGLSLELEPTEDYITENVKGETERAKQGDVLLVTRVNTGKVAIVQEETGVNQDIKVLKSTDEINNIYLARFLQSKQQYFENIKRGGTVSGITTSAVEKIEVPVPPLEEQERIVSEIEDRLDTINTLEHSINNIQQLSNEYEDSRSSFYLSGVPMDAREGVSGLPNDNNKLKKGWEIKELGEVVEYHSNLLDPSKTPEKEFSLIELADVEKNAGGLSNIQTKKGKNIGSNKREFTDDHILYCKLRPYLNKVVKPDFEGIASSELLVLEPSKEITQDYLYQYLSSPMVRDKAEFLMKGANHPRLSKSDLLSFNIAIPPKEKQNDIVNTLEILNSGQLNTAVKNLNQFFEEYKKSVLSEAFSGNI